MENGLITILFVFKKEDKYSRISGIDFSDIDFVKFAKSFRAKVFKVKKDKGFKKDSEKDNKL
jgi:thiamine pyrophosphate-dependent acetolactate synthase large subunit-like protein